MKIRELLNESAISSADLQKRLASTGLKLVPIPYDVVSGTGVRDTATNKFQFKSSKSSPIVNYDERMMVLVDVGGVQIPFYVSTGSGGKASVPAGKWYPVFGIGSSGWINKGTEEQINSYYGSPTLKSIALKLDSSIGDVRGTEYDVIPMLHNKGQGIPTMNRSLSPVSHGEDPYTNINNTLKKLGSKPLTTSAEPKTATSPVTPNQPNQPKQQYWHRNPDGSVELRER